MRVRGDLQPSVAFSLEMQPNEPGVVLARFYENAAPFEETRPDSDQKMTGFEYDEYHLKFEYYEGLEADIEANLETYLLQAKLNEAEKDVIPKLKAQVEELTAQNAELKAQNDAISEDLTNTQLGLCEAFEMITGGVS